MAKHLLFYDGECGFCAKMVQFVLKRDRNAFFLFAPLQGKTANEKLMELSEEQKGVDSLILIENVGEESQKILLQGKGALRIAWYLSFPWKLLGALSFLPSFLFDWAYALFARHRSSLGGKSCHIPSSQEKKRFLP